MLHSDFSSELLDMKETVIENIENSENLITISFSLKRRIYECPSCCALTDSVHDYRIQKVKDLPIHRKAVILSYRKRRYKCKCCREEIL